ncbi:apolipoprotein N-acyltransferase [Thalassotalea castellviae]|uniref:Apolipoprotein N-acyltransferase n=1 Tax=Thalassotalea castellviae TaxID=3075612 RepID=A0ABU3A3T6_9GAMM|nr:apolipoprotein N-acyltransferase [Thalassotalea sp. W431]MDT0604842.1 apolipoprotein N-acyltransferase [Thalassotalea sp. W431]
MFKSFLPKCKRNISDKTLWLSFIAGLNLVFSYAPFSFWWISFISLTLWFVHLEKLCQKKQVNTTRLLTKHSFIFGFGWFASGISWVHVSIAEFGGMPLFASLFLMLLLCLYLALFPTLAGYLTAKIAKTQQACSKLNLWLLPSIWLLTEYLRGVVLTGFPWLSLGYGQISGPLAPLAPIIGELGITFCLLIFCVALSKLILKSHTKQAGIALLSIFIITLFSHQQTWVSPTGKTIKTALIQGNIEQSIKWQPEQQWPTMLKYLDLTRLNYDAQLIIWPESAIPAIETMSTTQEFLDMANQSAALNNATIITGILNYNFETKEYFNSLIVLGKKHHADINGDYYYGNNNRYDKNHLLPIGEFVPFGDLLRPIAPLFNLPQSSFSRGSYVQDNLQANDLNILPLICFEIAFPEQLAANFYNDSDILLTVSNDAWFGNSHGPHQHMEIARMRALEFGRPLLRSTNTGVTAVTDHLGVITKQIPQFEQAVLTTEIQLVSGQTPYSQYGRYPIWFIGFLLIFINIVHNKVQNRTSLNTL